MPTLSIRTATTADAAALAELKRPYVEQTPYNFGYQAPSAEDFAEEIATTLARYPFLVAEDAEGPAAGTAPGAPRRILGYACAEPFRSREADGWNAELTIYLDTAARGRGVGTALYQELLRILAAQGVQNAYACITASNEPSLAFHEKLGFTVVGRFPTTGYKLGKWHDTVYLWRALGGHEVPPRAFVPFAELEEGARRG